ncbi:MAG: ornithine cyclodeaminase [Phycisphaerae bacterium SM23_30]|nr:MAG: ornithine cyclodeaminase [Phycisphaerae bacterium SM23_30]
MEKIFTLDQIKQVLPQIDPIEAIEQGFVAYSQGRVVVPPVGEMIFDHPPGDVHIKYGFIKNDDYYVIKIASGFYENVKLKLPSNNGMMLLFDRKTGQLTAVLLDEGYLTDVRTAAAGAVAAKYLAPKKVQRIGIFGAGIQGRLQLQYLIPEIDCHDVIVWSRSQKTLDNYKKTTEHFGLNIQTTLDARAVAASCNLIVTATPAQRPLISADHIQKGTHITAIGSDTPEKIELDPALLQKADLVVADSIEQSLLRGEIYQAIKAGCLHRDNLLELGNVIADKQLQRKSDDQITIADLTGVAVQDIQISKAVYKALTA